LLYNISPFENSMSYNNFTPDTISPYRNTEFSTAYGNNIYNGNNYQSAFRANIPILHKLDYHNRDELLHNNIRDQVQIESIYNYHIHIDSNDRDIAIYPNPFSFTVQFGGVGPSVSKRKNKTEIFPGSPNPIIQKEFKNVKFVKINYVILPRYIMYCKESHEFSHTVNNSLLKYKYLILKVPELSTNRMLSTNNIVGSDSFILYPDRTIGTNDIWVTEVDTVQYNISALGSISRLHFELQTPKGQVLEITDVCGKKLDKLNLDLDTKNMVISVTFGVMENELNTCVNYEV
jgi:hypothetical protein